MKIYIPSTSRSDVRNTDALKVAATKRGHDVTSHGGNHSGPDADVALILGDRHEMLQVAHDCIVHHVPYVHVGAGCVTRGSWDQRFRLMLTAGCTRFWTYTQEAKNNATFGYGYLDGHGVPILDTLKRSSRRRQSYALVAINPVTDTNVGEELEIVDELCTVLSMDVVWSHPNEDPGAKKLQDKLALAWPRRSLLDTHKTFAAALEECAFIIGNSSAALIEAPVLGTPYVDCGCRQEGRPGADGVRGHIAIRQAIECVRDRPMESYYQHPQRRACAEIIELAEEVAN